MSRKYLSWLVAATAAGFAGYIATIGTCWTQLVAYRTQDGIAFSHDLRAGTFGSTLMGHRCVGIGAEAIWSVPLTEPCSAGSTLMCRKHPEIDGPVFRTVEAFCYTAFPVSCGTPDNTGNLSFETCSRIFPHGFGHFKELLTRPWP